MTRPIVVIPACTKTVEGHTSDSVRRSYTAAVSDIAELQPVIVPVGAPDIGSVLDIADAILLPGSPSNVEPSHYGTEPPVLPDALDHARDALTLPLIREAIGRKIPIFAICRGLQEINVALGGTLHQAVHSLEGHRDHRAPADKTVEERFGPAHHISLRGRLREWIGSDDIIVNSVHGQGLARLGDGLQPEAFAEDGLVEAVRGPHDDAFCLGVQWHPEWLAKANPVSVLLFKRFGEAARGKQS